MFNNLTLFTRMSKFTISAVLGILRVLIGVLSRASRLIYAVIDLVDDGCLNASAPRPEWYDLLRASLDSIDAVLSHLNGINNECQAIER